MEEKFAPGPWHIYTSPYDGEQWVYSEGVKDGGDLICESPSIYQESMKHWPANIKLIVAAPDMYSILKHIVTYELAPNDVIKIIEGILKKVNE
jgi:hypothetical protein